MHNLARVSRLFLKYRLQAVAAYVCLFAGAGLALVIPRFTGQAIDLALGSGQRRTLYLLAGGIILAGFARGLVSYLQSYVSEWLSQRVAYDLRNLFYNRLQHLSYAFHDRSQTGQLMARATADVEAVRGFVGFALLRGVYYVILLVTVTALLVGLNWKLALISLSVVPFIAFRTIVINRKLRALWANIQQNVGVLGTILQENLSGVRVVRAFAREKQEAEKFRKRAEVIYNQEIEGNNLLASNSPVMSFAVMLSMAAILWYGGRLVVAGTLTQGELAQSLIYLVMLGAPVRMLGWLTTLFSRASASGKRIFEVLDQSSPVTEKPGAVDLTGVRGEVRFEHVSFAYDSHGPVLSDVDFDVQPGQKVALVGASGSGKSTIANLLPRSYDVTAGSILIDGVDVRDVTLVSLRRHVGIVHQETFLFSATIRDNISYGKLDATREEIERAARLARLHDFIVGLPSGYDTWVGERGITLSGGQKQRLAIARTLLMDPRILTMDDSTSSVDTETEYLIQQAFAELPAGRTTFIIAHRLRSVQTADMILVLKDGRIVERGRHEELLALGGVYRQLYGLQFQEQEEAAVGLSVPVQQNDPAASATLSLEQPVPTPAGVPAGRLKGSDEIVFGKPYDSRVVSRLARYFAAYKVVLPLTIVATLLYTFSMVASPYLVRSAENDYILKGNLGGLNLIALLFIANAGLNWVSYYAQIRAEALLGQGILLRLRNQLFEHLQHLPLHFFDANEVGRIMSRVQNDVGELGDFLDSGAFWVAGEIVSLIAIIVVLLTMNTNLALLTLSVVPLLLAFVIFWQTRARRTFIGVRQAIARVNAALEENISGVRVVQSLSREGINSQEFERVNHAHFEANLRAARVSAAMMPGVEAMVSLATGLIVLYGGLGVLGNTLLVGTLLAFILYIQNFFDPIRTLTMEYAQLQRAMASGSRILELMDVERETPAPRPVRLSAVEGHIQFQDVSFSYEPGLDVLTHVDIDMPAGKTTALVGPTGAGKTTIISLIARFYDVTGGRILVDGHDLRTLDRERYRRHIGLVLQDPFLFSGTVKDNIAYGKPEAPHSQIVAAAGTVGAHDFIAGLEKGYDTELQERGQNLSMGQRQLISLARALLADPAILLLDEATANVDSQSEHTLQEGIRRLLKGRTTVVIAHRLSTIRDADQIVVLEKGRVVEVGRHAELLARGGLYTRLHEMTYAAIAAKPSIVS